MSGLLSLVPVGPEQSRSTVRRGGAVRQRCTCSAAASRCAASSRLPNDRCRADVARSLNPPPSLRLIVSRSKRFQKNVLKLGSLPAHSQSSEQHLHLYRNQIKSYLLANITTLKDFMVTETCSSADPQTLQQGLESSFASFSSPLRSI